MMMKAKGIYRPSCQSAQRQLPIYLNGGRAYGRWLPREAHKVWGKFFTALVAGQPGA